MNILVYVFLLTDALTYLGYLTVELLGHGLYLRNILFDYIKAFFEVCLLICISTEIITLPIDLQPHQNFA